MVFLFLGTDREKARAQLHAESERIAEGARIVRITDVSTTDDLKAALWGGGLFAEKRVLIIENVRGNEEMWGVLLDALARGIPDPVFVFEEKLLAADKKKLEKYAEKIQIFDAPKKERSESIFSMANALRRGDKKELWVSYMRELEKGSAPEAIHGVLFWAVKDAFVKSGGRDTRVRELITALAELPHVARREGEDLEYALERFVLSGA